MSSPFIWNGIFAKSLKPNVNINDAAYILTGTANPTVAPGISAPLASIYLNTATGYIYVKGSIADTSWAAPVINETDPLSIHLNGSNSPTANISMGNHALNGLSGLNFNTDNSGSIGTWNGSGTRTFTGRPQYMFLGTTMWIGPCTNDFNASYKAVSASSGSPAGMFAASYVNTGGGPNAGITLAGARGTPTAPQVLHSGDTLGQINFNGFSGSSIVNSASIWCNATESFNPGRQSQITFLMYTDSSSYAEPLTVAPYTVTLGLVAYPTPNTDLLWGWDKTGNLGYNSVTTSYNRPTNAYIGSTIYLGTLANETGSIYLGNGNGSSSSIVSDGTYGNLILAAGTGSSNRGIASLQAVSNSGNPDQRAHLTLNTNITHIYDASAQYQFYVDGVCSFGITVDGGGTTGLVKFTGATDFLTYNYNGGGPNISVTMPQTLDLSSHGIIGITSITAASSSDLDLILDSENDIKFHSRSGNIDLKVRSDGGYPGRNIYITSDGYAGIGVYSSVHTDKYGILESNSYFGYEPTLYSSSILQLKAESDISLNPGATHHVRIPSIAAPSGLTYSVTVDSSGNLGSAPAVGSVASVVLTNQSGTIGSTVLAASPPAGMYLLSAAIITTASQAVSNAVTAEIDYTDVSGSPGANIFGCDVHNLGDTNANTTPILCDGVSNITYTVTFSGTMTTGRYALYITLSKL